MLYVVSTGEAGSAGWPGHHGQAAGGAPHDVCQTDVSTPSYQRCAQNNINYIIIPEKIDNIFERPLTGSFTLFES